MQNLANLASKCNSLAFAKAAMPKQHECSSAKLSVGRKQCVLGLEIGSALWSEQLEIKAGKYREIVANTLKIQNHSERSEPCTGYISDRSQTFASQRGNLRSQRFWQIATGTNAHDRWVQLGWKKSKERACKIEEGRIIASPCWFSYQILKRQT